LFNRLYFCFSYRKLPDGSDLMLKLAILGFAATAGVMIGSPLFAEVRRCQVAYVWETTGGTIGPKSFGPFAARGECGATVPNRCRDRARVNAQQCIAQQWERRWDHYPLNSDGTRNFNIDTSPPEACENAAFVENYDLRTTCVRDRRDGFDPDAICHEGVHSTNALNTVVLGNRGDLKTAIEAQVCCKLNEGKQNFSNNRDVRVRVSAIISSTNDPQNRCNATVPVSSDYQINCERVRATVCN
jgi:hypothetical protein